MKKVTITTLLIIFSISFCQAQSLQEAAKQQQQKETRLPALSRPPVEKEKTTEISEPTQSPVAEEEISEWTRPAVQEEVIVEEEIFVIVEQNPEYPGGDEARMNFLRNNLKYPQMAHEAGIQGTVYVGFVVEKDGSVTQVKVMRGIGGGCDEEAVRVAKMMPKWKPGKQRGKEVRVSYTMPIKFTLQD